MLVLCYPKCGTCKKALKWLEENKVGFNQRDIVEDNPSEKEIKKWHRMSGLPLRKFFNTSGLKYRELNLKDKLPEMDEKEMYKLLASDGMLVKRPLAILDDKVLVGFKQAEWEELK